MNQEPDVTIIIVNWNSLKFLRGCLESIYRHTTSTVEILVFDNASTEKIDAISSEYPEVRLICGDSNYGFAHANNKAAALAKGRFLLFLNPDTVLIDSTVEPMLDAGRNMANAGIVGVKLLNEDLSIQTSCIQKYPTILNQLLDIEVIRLRWPSCPLWGLGPLFQSGVQSARVEAVSGACFIIGRDIFMELGGFSEDYFMYGEDIDLSYRCQAAGYDNIFLNLPIVIHFGGKSSGQQHRDHWPTMMRFESVALFLRKTRGRLYAIAFRFAMGAAAIGRLGVMLAAWPLNKRLFDGSYAVGKWRAVLMWASGVAR